MELYMIILKGFAALLIVLTIEFLIRIKIINMKKLLKLLKPIQDKINLFVQDLINLLVKVYLAEDKMKHFIAGFFIYILFQILIGNNMALLATILIAVAKEVVYDKMLKKGKAELLDVYMTIFPALLMYFIL